MKHSIPKLPEPRSAILPVLGAMAFIAVMTGCSPSVAGADSLAMATAKPTATSSTTSVTNVTFDAWSKNRRAISYDPTALPKDAGAYISLTTAPNGTTVWARMTGLRAGAKYSLALHQNACGTEPGSSGAIYKNAQESPDSADNVARLSLDADRNGGAQNKTTSKWNLRPNGAKSMLVSTRDAAHKAVGCITLR